jgi:16S rRNA (uracil1498-N3)-methyltransferase
MNLILLDPAELDPHGLARVAGDRARHMRDVLRVTPGSTVRIGVVDGPLGIGTVTHVDDASIGMTCALESEPPPVPGIDVLMALPRPKVLRRLWAQLAAIGVGRIMLTNAEKVERDYFDAHVVREETYRPLLIEGLQQARDTRVPVVTVHKRFKPLVEDELDAMCPSGVRMVAHPGVERTVAEALRGRQGERVLVAIGPEGGWNDFELALLAARGFEPVGMGARPLRSDTAAIALLSLVGAAMHPHSGT